MRTGLETGKWPVWSLLHTGHFLASSGKVFHPGGQLPAWTAQTREFPGQATNGDVPKWIRVRQSFTCF